MVRMRLSTSALRTIEHKGGFDAFLLGARTPQLPTDLRRLKKQVEKARAQG
jgi:large subunit ribosomal protein L28